MTKHLALYNLYTVRIAAVLAALLAMAVFVYGACMLLAVAHTAQMSNAETQARALSSRTSSLESAYLSQSALLTEEQAATLGFVAPSEQWVVYTSPDTLSLSR